MIGFRVFLLDKLLEMVLFRRQHGCGIVSGTVWLENKILWLEFRLDNFLQSGIKKVEHRGGSLGQRVEGCFDLSTRVRSLSASI